MGVYYQIYNNTKKETVDLDGHIKRGPMLHNMAVHYATMVYLFENQGDEFQMLADSSEIITDEQEEYKNVDLLSYPYEAEGALDKIVKLLNKIYKREAYKISDGVGVEV